MSDREPTIGDRRIVEQLDHPLSREWTWRYSVEEFFPEERFLWWKTPARWLPVYSKKTYSDCAAFIAEGGNRSRVIE